MRYPRRSAHATSLFTWIAFVAFAVVLLGTSCGSGEHRPPTSEETQALLEEAIVQAGGELAVFAGTGVDPCGLEVTESTAVYVFPYEDLPSLVNDVDFIVEGEFGRSRMESLEPGKVAIRMPVEFEVHGTIAGDSPGRRILVEAGGRVAMSRDQPRRSHVPWLDQCAVEDAILFFDGPTEEGMYDVVAHIAFADGKSEADPIRELIEEGASVDEVRADIVRMVDQQRAGGVPKGRLLCESRRHSQRYNDPRVCPGDSFNPYVAYGLARPISIDIRQSDSDGHLLASRRGIPIDSPRAVSLLTLLDRTVTIVSGGKPQGSAIELSVATATTGMPPYDVHLEYDIAEASIWVPVSHGRFPAPTGFRAALEELLDRSSEAQPAPTASPEPPSAPTMQRGVPARTPADPRSGSGPEMRLTLVSGGHCEGQECYARVGAGFILAVEVVQAPAEYVLLQTFIDYGLYDPAASEDGAGPNSCGDGVQNGYLDGTDRSDTDCVTLDLTYLPTASAADEIFWSDLEPASAVRANTAPGVIGHGGLTGLIPPLLESTETGVIVQVQMRCPAHPTTVPISLLVYGHPLAATSGTVFVRSDGETKVIPRVSPINLHCVR